MPKLTKDQAKTVEESEGGDFPLLDDGLYGATLTTVTAKEGQRGTYWEWQFNVYCDEDQDDLEQSITLWENTSLSEKAAWRLKDMFAGFGVDIDTATEDLEGEFCWLNVGHEISAQGKSAGKPRNIFLSIVPAEEDEE